MNTRLTNASSPVRSLGVGVAYELAPAAARAIETMASGFLGFTVGYLEYEGIGLLYEGLGRAGVAYPVNGLCVFWIGG